MNSLFEQVNELINERTGGNVKPLQPSIGGPQVSINPNVVPQDAGVQIQFQKLQSTVNALQTTVSNLKEHIIYGLDTYAVGGNIIAVTAGKIFTRDGVVEFNTVGRFAIPESNEVHTQISIDTSAIKTLYLTLSTNNNLTVNEFITNDDLIIAKIVISNIDGDIENDANESRTNNYIVSGKDLVFNSQFKLDDDTKLAIRDVLTEVMAENLTGELKLNEGLKITNQNNSVQLTSNEMGIYDGTDKLAEFNKDGIGFYQSNGQALAQYTRSGATIGQIRITPTTLQSMNFNSGARGFRIESDGDAEFNNVTVRGTIVARDGTIGKWLIARDRLTNTGDTTGLAPQDYPFYAGASFDNRATAPFRVDTAGEVWATNAHISGIINATYISATSGMIGGWTIQEGLLSGGVMKLYASGVINSTNFNVSNTGVVSATSAVLKTATVSGAITCSTLTANTAGTIGGFTIGTTTLSAGGTLVLDSSGDGELTIGNPSSTHIQIAGGATSYIQSSNFDNSLTTPKGFRLSSDGIIEAVDGYFSGKLKSNVFVKDEVNVIAGDLILANSSRLTEAASTTEVNLSIESGVFSIDDLLKVSNNSDVLKVIGVYNGGITILDASATNYITGQTGVTSYPIWKSFYIPFGSGGTFYTVFNIVSITSGNTLVHEWSPPSVQGRTFFTTPGIKIVSGTNLLDDTIYNTYFFIDGGTVEIDIISVFKTISHPTFKRSDVIYKIGEYDTNDKGYIELLGNDNIIKIHDVDDSTGTTTNNTVVELGLLTQGTKAGQYGLYAQTAEISGNITATTLTTQSGIIGGWTIGATTLSGGSTILNSDGTITCRKLVADTSGTIGGWSISSDKISASNLILYSSGVIYSDNFSVGNTGILSATGAVITGSTVVSGNITAKTLTCDSGTIGGWTIGANSLTGGSTVLNSTGEISSTGLTINSKIDPTDKYGMSVQLQTLSSFVPGNLYYGFKLNFGDGVTFSITSGTYITANWNEVHLDLVDANQNAGKFGTFSRAKGESFYNYGVYGVASGEATWNIGTAGVANSHGTSTSDIYRTYGGSFIADSTVHASGGGSWCYGLHTQASADEGRAYGIYTSAFGGTSGTATGIYAFATGAATNYAGYFQGNVHIAGTLSKTAGSFDIPHPNLEKPKNTRLRHYFVETPSAGGNIYKYQINCKMGENILELPDYFDYLNKDNLVYVTPFKHFGIGYGEVIDNNCIVNVNQNGIYNILIFGDRKDELAIKEFNKYGIEYINNDIIEHDNIKN